MTPIEITATGILGLRQSTISCAPIALVGGANGQGKSSLALAISAALTGDPLLSRFELKKPEAKRLVHRGAKDGRIVICTADSQAKMTWPEGKLTTEGPEPPHATDFAVGRLSIATMKPEDRAKALLSYLKAEPTEADLTAAMAEKYHPEAIANLWAEIGRNGWDTAHAGQVERRRDAGRDWSKITNTAFGADKAARWRPEDWEELWDPTPGQTWEARIAEAEEKVKAAEAEIEKAVANAAVDSAQLETLRAVASLLEDRQKGLQEATTAAETAEKVRAEAEAKRKALLEPVNTAGLPCPHCGERVVLVQAGPASRLEKAVTVDPEENRRRQEAIASADGILSRAVAEASAAQRVKAEVAHFHNASKDAVDQIAALGERRGAAGLVDRARDDKANAEHELKLVRQVAEATTYHMRWLSADGKIDILAPDGLRKTKLAQAVDAYNRGILAPLCDAAGWPHVNLTEELVVRMEEEPYGFLAESQKFKVRVVLQMAFAGADGSSMVVIDAADILVDGQSRFGLVNLLQHAGLPAVVLMAFARTDQIPNLEQAGIGLSYVIAGGVTRSLAEALEAA